MQYMSSSAMTVCISSCISCFWFAVQCIHRVTKMCAKMKELADSTSLSTCVNAVQNTVDHSVRVSKPITPDISVEAVNYGYDKCRGLY